MLCSDTIIDTRPPSAGLTMMQVESISEFPATIAAGLTLVSHPPTVFGREKRLEFGHDARLLLPVLTCDQQLSTANLRPTSPVVRGDKSKIRRQMRGQIDG
jgi:hypothetical protein